MLYLSCVKVRTEDNKSLHLEGDTVPCVGTFIYTYIFIGVSYPQVVLNYELDCQETWMACSLGYEYVH